MSTNEPPSDVQTTPAQTTRTVALLQTEPAFGEISANLDAVEQAIEGLTVDLLVLPEFFATGYSFRDRAEADALAESFEDGETIARLKAWSRRTGGMIVAGYPEREGEKLYNAAAIVVAGEARESYRNLHLFGFESEVFEPGNRALPVVEHAGMRVGTMICFDWIFPEVVRSLALGGADVIAHPSNLVLPGWCQRAMRVRALENHVYTVTANRVGTEQRVPRPALAFTGVSRICDPSGEVMADAPAAEPALLRATVDLSRARDKQIPSGNCLFLERRPAFYLQSAPEDPGGEP